MVDAPEKIRVAQDSDGFWTCREAVSGSQEYVRADLVAELEAENEWLKHVLEAANKRADEAEALAERLKREAQLHAQEARTANATIAEIYREVSGGKGESGNWNGAEPVRAELAKMTCPDAVFLNMLRGTIAKPSVAQIKHLYGDAVADTADLTRAAEQAVTDEMVERAAAALRPDLFVPLSADELQSNDFALTERENATANTRRKARAALTAALKGVSHAE